MTQTKLLYLENFNTYTCDSTVLDILKENEKNVVILNQTVFYPQGGGQPSDMGIIEGSTGKFLVLEVRFADGIVKHIGTFESGHFTIGETVTCFVDEMRRTLHSRLHSAGHVIDMAVTTLKLPWTPGKGFHFPEGPNVEYKGILEGFDVDKLKITIENLCNKLIQEGRETKILFMDKDKMRLVCHFVPEYIPEGKPGRVVIYGDDFGVPCGGTHVNNISAIRHMTIRKIKMEKGNIRISYDIARM